MRSLCRHCRTFAAAATICAGVASAQPADPSLNFGQRYDAFSLLFADGGFSIAKFRDLRYGEASQYKSWILVVLGEPRAVLGSGFSLTSFVEGGGSLLYANDRRSILTIGPCQVTIHPGPDFGWNPDDCFEGRPHFPLIREFVGSSELFADVRTLVTNHPGFLQTIPKRWPVVANFPRLPALDPDAFLVARAEEGSGRFLVVADPSIFTNEMIQEADNARFAQNAIAWLAAGRQPESLKVAVVIDGVSLSNWVDKRFETGDWEGPKLDTTELVNELLDGLQKEDAFNELARAGQDALSDRGPWPVRQAVLIMLASIVLACMVWRVFAARRPEEKVLRGVGFARMWTSTNQATESGSLVPADRLLEHRQREIARHGNYAGPLKELAASFWNRRFPTDVWSTSRPRMKTRMGFFAGRRYASWVRSLWSAAKGTNGEFVSDQAFRAWRTRIAEIDVALRQGDLAIEFRAEQRSDTVGA